MQWFSCIVKLVKMWRKNLLKYTMKLVNSNGICFQLSYWNRCRPSYWLPNSQCSFLALAVSRAHEKFSKRCFSQFIDCLSFYFVQLFGIFSNFFLRWPNLAFHILRYFENFDRIKAEHVDCVMRIEVWASVSKRLIHHIHNSIQSLKI